jgi:hypothetical protein
MSICIECRHFYIIARTASKMGQREYVLSERAYTVVVLEGFACLVP